ncbi:MAG: acireductone synthase, partial [Gemmatimonadales bacterium]
MSGFLERHWNDSQVRQDIAKLKAEHAAESSPPPWRDDAAGVVAYVQWLMDRDRKSTGLKSLQGKIWEEAYRAGDLRGEVYPDVPPAMELWRQQGI